MRLRRLSHMLTIGLLLAVPAPAQDAPTDRLGALPANTEMAIDGEAAVQRARELVRSLPDPSNPQPGAGSTEARELGAAPAALSASESRALGSRRDDAQAGDGLSGGNWVLNTLTALGMVLVLVLAMRWLVSRVGGRPAAAPSLAVEVLSRTAVAPKNHVVLLRVGGRVLVVGDSSQGLRSLTEIDDPEEVASLLQAVEAQREASITHSFNRMLARYGAVDASKPLRAEEGGDDGEFRIDRARASVSGLLGRVRAAAGKEAGR